MTADGHSGQTPDTSQYEAIVESISEAAYFLDSAQNLAYTNQSSLQHPAVSLDAVRGGHVMDLIKQIVADEEDPATFERALETVYDETADAEFPVTVELDIALPTGTATREYRCSPCETESGIGAVVVSGETTGHSEPELKRYEQLFETLPVAVGVNSLGESGQFEFVNQAAVAMFGAESKEDLKQHSPRDLYTDPEEGAQFADRVREEQTVEQYETEFTTLDGEELWVSTTAELTEIDGEQRIVGIVEDISERKQREREIRDEKAFTAGFLDSLHDVFYAFDAEANLVEYNERLCSVTGYDPEELETMTPWEFFPADERELIMEAVGDVIETGESIHSLEAHYLTKSGEEIPYEFSGSPYYDSDGTVAGFVGFGRDISDRTERDRELREKQERLRRLFDEAPDPMFVQDEEGKFTDVNEKAVEKLGYSREELLEMEAADIDAAVDRADSRELLSVVKADGQTTEIEGRHQRADGSTYPVDVRVTPLETDGEDLFLSYARDITERKEREQRLKKLQERLNVAVKGAEIGTWDWDIDTDEVIFNDAWATMLGYTRDELDFHFDVWEELVHPADLEGVTAAVEANMADKTDFWEEEIRMETKSGDWKWVWTIGRVVERDEERNPVRAGGIHIDIDDRKQADLRLKQSERQFDAVFNDPQLLVSVLDTEGVVQKINETALNSAPATREQTEGTLFSELPWWTYDEMVQKDIEKRVAQATSGEYVEFESEAHVADERRMALSGSFRPVTDADGEVVSVVASGRDITERKLRKQELERKQNFLKQTQEVADVGGWEVDLRSNSLRWTEEVYRIHGLGSDFEPTVEGAIDLYHSEDQAKIREAVEQATTAGKPYDMEVRIVRPDGEIRWTRALGEPWYEGDEIVGARGTFQDITERKEREAQLRESNERLEQFAYVASHDLQEPLRTISNYTEILEKDYADELDEEAKRFIDVVVTGSERMQSMINGLLDYSRVTTRGGEFESVDTEQVVTDIEADLEVMLDEHDGTVETETLPTVEADGDQLHQVFQNLVKNALEHSGDDPATIEIRATEEPSQYRFEVEDDGPGIAESRQEKIFRIFKSGQQYQTESQAKGLGLAICDNIVRRHGGDIWVESEPSEGATFVFTIRKDKDSAELSSKKQ